MKQKLLFIICIIYLNISAIAQAPQVIPYQAVARDNSGNLIENKNISIRFSIHDVTVDGSVIYNETQSVTTNSLGLFTANIGQGTPITGIFSSINWGNGSKFIQIEIDITGGNTYLDMGTQQMMSVPYALFAASGNQGPPGPPGPAGANGDRYTTTSSTVLSIILGTQYLTIGAELNYAIGQTVIISYTASNLMIGDVTSYNVLTGEMVVNITSVIGSGNFSSWNVSLNSAAGPAGPPGASGATWYLGVGAPSGAAGIVNDLFLNTSNGNYYKKTSLSTWDLQGSLTGPQGLQGITGATGTAGMNGSSGVTWLTGIGTPNGVTGIMNDLYLNTNNGDYYKKTGSSTWTLQGNLTGPQGAPGSAFLPNGTVAGNTPYWNGTTWLVNSNNIFNNGNNIGIGTSSPNNSAQLEVNSTTKGFLPPRMTYAQKVNITSPVTGLVLWCANCGTLGELQVYNGTTWTNMVGGAASPIPPPALITTVPGSITLETAISGGNVTSDYGFPVTSRGICWSSSPSPTIALDTKTSDGTGTGIFNSNITGIIGATTYYVRAYATNVNGTGYGNEISFTSAPFTIGASFMGGKIAYVLQPGDPGYNANIFHGLIAAPSDLSAAPWGCQGTIISGADGTALGTGNQNTIDIMNGCPNAGIAARICGDLILNGYSDWFLPSVEEIDKLYINRVAIGGFTTNNYWTSTEVSNSDTFADADQFINGQHAGRTKFNSFSVRAIRTF